MKLRAIHRFSGAYEFLSNFFELPVAIEWEGMRWTTTEHAFQAAKTTDPAARVKIRDAKTPAQAKKLGRAAALRPGWDAMKIGVMEDLLRLKFSISLMRKKLLDTGDLELVEGNDWGDRFWGVSGGEGENQLGKALMKIRAEIRAEKGQEKLDASWVKHGKELVDHLRPRVYETEWRNPRAKLPEAFLNGADVPGLVAYVDHTLEELATAKAEAARLRAWLERRFVDLGDADNYAYAPGDGPGSWAKAALAGKSVDEA